MYVGRDLRVAGEFCLGKGLGSSYLAISARQHLRQTERGVRAEAYEVVCDRGRVLGAVHEDCVQQANGRVRIVTVDENFGQHARRPPPGCWRRVEKLCAPDFLWRAATSAVVVVIHHGRHPFSNASARHSTLRMRLQPSALW